VTRDETLRWSFGLSRITKGDDDGAGGGGGDGGVEESVMESEALLGNCTVLK
jgi:hypothetical protein